MPALPPLVSIYMHTIGIELMSYLITIQDLYWPLSIHCLYFYLQIDTIDPVPGVTVREGGRIMCGAKRHQSLQPPTSPRSGMRLVRPLDPHKHSPTQDTLNNKQ